MEQRSAVAKLCRAQCYPPSSTKLAKMTNTLPTVFRQDVLPLCQSPLLAGLVLQLVLAAPMSQREVERTYTQSMLKEMSVMESVKRDCTLSFEPFFGDYTSTIHVSIPCNPAVARFVHTGIDRWIRSLQNQLLYPKIGGRTVSKVTAHELRMVDPDYILENEMGVTPRDLERVYHRYGVHVPGPCEMRQKWYCSNLQPRTYYAQGGDAFRTSKYLAIPLVDLCDTLPSTNRRTRVDPGRIVVREPTDDVAYYDLTSFTSNLHVHCLFMYRLAAYCSGVDVRILDSVSGITHVDLGNLIYEYTRTNLHDPPYTIAPTYGDPSVLHYHSVAGFLGVYGNIASATYIHGIVMAMRHSCLDENNVAGDDGLDVTNSVDDTLALVRTMGTVVYEKTFCDSEGCCIHLKRPIQRIGNRLLHGQLVTWPSLEPGQKLADSRYPYLKRLSNRARRDTIASSITAFLRKLEHQSLDNTDLDIVDTILSYMYATYGLPKAGCVPQVTPGRQGFVPIYERRFIGLDPLSNTITRHYANIAIVPLRGHLSCEVYMLEDATFRCNSTKLLKHLVSLGYLHQEKIRAYVYGHEGLQLLIQEYTDPDPPIYEYTIVSKLPVWAFDVIASNSM